jgi:hypothetical protein
VKNPGEKDPEADEIPGGPVVPEMLDNPDMRDVEKAS